MTAEPKARKERPPPTPKQRKPWDPPPLPKVGDKHEDMTFAAVGRALTAWEKLEYRLANLFAVYVNASKTDIEPAVRAFGSIMASSGRMDMLRAAAAAHFAMHPNEPIWQKSLSLFDEVSGYAPRRNEIAHGVVRSDRTLRDTVQGKSYALFPAWYVTAKHKIVPAPDERKTLGLPPSYYYSSVEIIYLADAFGELRRRIESLWQETIVSSSVARARAGFR